MKCSIWFVPLLGVLAGCPVPQRTDTPVQARHVREPHEGATYLLYVPSYYKADRTWPLVVTLHGTPYWDTYDKQIHEWQFVAEKRGLIVVAPKLRSVQGILPKIRSIWYDDLDRDERAILAVIADVRTNYRIDPKAILLTGFSSGGFPMYDTGLRHPELFSMLVARACNSDVGLFERIRVTEAVRKMPIAIYWGKDDLPPIRDQSWSAFRWLRLHDCFETEMKMLKGGHLRRPELAYELWRPHLPPQHHR